MNKAKKHNRITPIAAAALLALIAEPGHAQDAQQAAQSAQAAPPAQLERVEVTANKRVEQLENVPQAISVFTSERLERNNVRSLEDVIDLSPAMSITYGTTPANNGINMRGIGTSSIGIGVESDVSVIIDDIPVGMQFQAFKDLADVQRVEILKGPQSTLFGKSAIAGAVLVTTKPISGPISGEASAMFTSDGETRLRASVSGEVAEHLGLRIAASSNNYDGNINNLSTGGKVNGSKGTTLMGKLAWHPTEQIDVELTPSYNQTRSDCCVFVLTSFSPLQGALENNIAALPASKLLAGITPGPDNRDTRMDYPTGIESTIYGGAAKVNYYAPNGMTLTSITSSQHYTANDYRDQDFTDVPTLLYFPLANGKPAGVNAGYTQYGTYLIKSYTEELRLTSPDSGNFRYVAGLWWASNNIDRYFVRGYNGIALSTPVSYFGTTYNRNTAAFGQATWEFMPGTTAVAGLRFNRQVSGYSMALGNPPPGAFIQTSYFSSLGNKENSTTGKLSLQHQFTKGLMAYVMTSTGYKGQAYDITSGLTAATAAEQPVASETARNWELGIKGNFLNNRLTLNMAAFDTKFKNYQQNSGGYLPGTTTYVTRLNSIGGVQTRGLEMDMAALVTPEFIVNADVAYTKATVSDWANAPCYNVAGSTNGGFNASCVLKNPAYGGQNTQDVTGGVMPNAPKWKLGLSGRYDLPLREVPFNAFFSGTLRYRSDTLTNINQDPTLAAPGVTIVNIGTGIKTKDGKIQLGFFINNLFDRHYANTGFSGLGNWSAKAPNPVVSVTQTTWTPARDAFRYEAVRLDVKF